MRWLPPLGFQNTYAIAVTHAAANRYRLRTLSDLARESPHLTAGFTADFIGRSDGLVGLSRVYGLKPRAIFLGSRDLAIYPSDPGVLDSAGLRQGRP